MPAEGARRVLVVEDEEDVRHSVELVLSQAGFAVETARDGKEGLHKIAACRPDLVVLDLPVRDGIEVLRRVRAEPGPQPRVVMLSALGDLSRAHAATAWACSTKPFSPHAFLAICPQALTA
jgi:DNA-binding response OmpR family regulator